MVRTAILDLERGSIDRALAELRPIVEADDGRSPALEEVLGETRLPGIGRQTGSPILAAAYRQLSELKLLQEYIHQIRNAPP